MVYIQGEGLHVCVVKDNDIHECEGPYWRGALPVKEGLLYTKGEREQLNCIWEMKVLVQPVHIRKCFVETLITFCFQNFHYLTIDSLVAI